MNEMTNRKQALQSRIGELEDTISHLKDELKKEEESEQHAAIDNLEKYLSELDNKYSNLKEFWQVLREEIRDLLPGSSSKKGE
jgi:chromosome segregation ATPase